MYRSTKHQRTHEAPQLSYGGLGGVHLPFLSSIGPTDSVHLIQWHRDTAELGAPEPIGTIDVGYRKVSNTRRTKSQNLDASRLIL